MEFVFIFVCVCVLQRKIYTTPNRSNNKKNPPNIRNARRRAANNKDEKKVGKIGVEKRAIRQKKKNGEARERERDPRFFLRRQTVLTHDQMLEGR